MSLIQQFEGLNRASSQPDPRPARRLPSARLPAGVAFALQVSIILLFLAGSAAPTPLYAVYEARRGFSPITMTVVFGIYAIAVLLALLSVGSLSDHVGRRPVLVAAIALQAASMVVFATAEGVTALLVARVVQGIATGAAAGTIGAGLLDLHRTRGTIANGVGPIAGTATGSIGSGLLVEFLPEPTRLVYLLLLGGFVVQAFLVLWMPETSSRKPGALASLAPRFAMPAHARRSFLIALPVLVAVWSLAGLYASLGPTLVHLVSGSGSVALGGLSLTALAGSGAITVFFVHPLAAEKVMLYGTAAVVAGVGITLAGIDESSTALFFVGGVVAGAGFGAGFQGALRTVLPLAAAHERAGVLSTIYVVCYLAMGAPAVIAGYLVVHSGGVLTTAREFSVVVMGLALLALVALLWSRTTSRTAVAYAEPVAARERQAQRSEVAARHRPVVSYAHPQLQHHERNPRPLEPCSG